MHMVWRHEGAHLLCINASYMYYWTDKTMSILKELYYMLFLNTTELFQEVNMKRKWFESMLEQLPMPAMFFLEVQAEDLVVIMAEGEFILMVYELFHDETHDDHDSDIAKFMCSCHSAVTHIKSQTIKQIQSRELRMTKRNQKEDKRDEDNR